MKKTLILTMLTLLTTGVRAADYDYLVITKTDGTKQALPASELSITFSGGNLVAKTGSTTLATIAQSELSSMEFSNDGTTAIEAFSATAGAHVTISNLQGMLIKEFTAQENTLKDVVSGLPTGIYIIKVNNKVTKLQVK